MIVRPATRDDDNTLWAILEPTLRAGDTYALPRDISREAGLAYWHGPGHHVFVTADGTGTYFLRANPEGDGANAAYMTAPAARGRGVARAMCADSIERARAMGYTVMQFNFVVSANERAVRLWQAMGFAIVHTLPRAFAHPVLGAIDAYVMRRAL